jgi:DNA recombination protein RmuC
MLILLAGIAGLSLGLLIGLGIWHRSRARSDREAADLRLRIAGLEKDRDVESEKVSWVRDAEEKMRDAFKALAGDALRSNSESLTAQTKKDIESVVDPLKKNLDSLDGHVRELEKSRQGAYESLERQLTHLREAHTKLQETTINLAQALQSPTVRGRWGEFQLRRVVEMAGMEKNVDFKEQASTDSGRPDLIARLPNGGVLPVDAKVPLNAYLDAMETSDPSARKAHLARHAQAMRTRIRELGQKQYWEQFDSSPDFVVMFVPNEACLGAAFEQDPGLLEYAISNKILISSPVTLLALLRTVAYGWQQHQITANAIKIAQEGRELYHRLETLIRYFDDLGGSIRTTVQRYNRVVGSLGKRLMPAARRFQELGLSNKELDPPSPVDVVPSDSIRKDRETAAAESSEAQISFDEKVRELDQRRAKFPG